jgi:hypothetical protein
VAETLYTTATAILKSPHYFFVLLEFGGKRKCSTLVEIKVSRREGTECILYILKHFNFQKQPCELGGSTTVLQVKRWKLRVLCYSRGQGK